MARLYANNFTTSLNGAITDVATSMTLNSVTGFPAVGGGDTCQVTIDDGTNIEVVTATAIAGSVITITRGQEGTSGTAFGDGDPVEIRLTSLAFTDVLGADTTPQLEGPLAVNGNQITSASSGDIELHSDNDVNIILGDAAGADDFNIKDSASAIVASIDSDGALEATSISFDTGTNALDYYETGTWTPTLVGQSVAGTPTYTNQTGSYTRIGDRVICHVRLDWSSLGSLSGNAEIHGLPFTSVNDSGKRAFFFSHFYSGLSLPNNGLCGYVNFNATTILMLYMNTAATSNVTDTELTAAGAFYGSIIYEAS